jgi:hypothetical protein
MKNNRKIIIGRALRILGGGALCQYFLQSVKPLLGEELSPGN